ncbi:MAG: hemerythrin family protein [Azonexus sp.]|jgi:hemerythrin-like metal-binding protein|nr:hemerythrin family protein [Betaproteobacteria bacterium]MBK8919749.1 hemerythrin family protein [Betaproteobacteria bacterium]MBP6034994.1 hemerythrin family protein [Azonexus sp.]MBP6905700.1 hemerythrin family protein [Azonexus sp.]
MDRDILAPALPCPTGHAEIDLEHSLLMACVNRLNSVCRIPDSRCSCRDCLARMQSECHADLGNLLGDLLMYLVDHFRTEETLMRSHGVARIAPDFCERHKEDHAAIALTIQELTTNLDPMQTADLVGRLHRLLSYWLQDHIARHDAVLVRFLPTSAA